MGFDINSKGTGLGLKNIEGISKMFDIKYTLQSNSEGQCFHLKILKFRKLHKTNTSQPY